ncbi:sugar transport/efflux pump [Afipia carboxidovorans OM5]|uniref:Uncharacterized protein n=1 Tax=Afipia carboxidovorans (strain ATCC 49405 / DSM 1227 / KCTC 32145 / OM5) TaxID=504832 RepID=B6JK55_AFIC5|nr:sugar transport/efflux pump [Afipia carboxidovorans OM5]AEI04676.1 hypothetical protein OCA4_pOC167B01090 [Afipia carboxidovorans OM4]AEI08305.1 hypothetical protein OCA5_pOC16701090 [Afipia carboxidovorans OM5]
MNDHERPRSASIGFGGSLGYAIGALSAGLIADRFGLSWAIISIAALTFDSGAVVAIVMRARGKHPSNPIAAASMSPRT